MHVRGTRCYKYRRCRSAYTYRCRVIELQRVTRTGTRTVARETNLAARRNYYSFFSKRTLMAVTRLIKINLENKKNAGNIYVRLPSRRCWVASVERTNEIKQIYACDFCMVYVTRFIVRGILANIFFFFLVLIFNCLERFDILLEIEKSNTNIRTS